MFFQNTKSVFKNKSMEIKKILSYKKIKKLRTGS